MFSRTRPTAPIRHRSPLRLELLEERELFAVNLRIADYNIAGDARSGLATILRAIGDEVVAGTARPLDVLALQETDSQATDTQAVVDLLNGIYGASTYARGSTNGATTGAGTQGLVYRTSTIQLLSETAFGASVAGGVPRQVLRYNLRPIGFSMTSDFYLYVGHPKASDTTADANLRNDEAVAVRANMDALGQGTNIIYAADTNFYRSSEPGWATYTSAGNGQLIDPINRVGNWNNNSTFADVHTQAPSTTARFPGQITGGMDDRFDMQLVSGELTDGTGLDIIPTSYHVLGNNGTTFNDDIDALSNTWVWNPVGGSTVTRSDLLTALASVSDHLPVIADYTIVGSGAAASTTTLVSGANPSVSGQAVTFTATVTGGSGTPTGTVTFFDGATSIGTGALNGSGVATLVTSTLSVATHTITASYGGNGTYATSTSAAVSQVVNKANTTLALASSATPSNYGQPVTFTATPAVTAPGSGTPTGTVTFFDGATQIGTATISGASATFTTTALVVATHSITAQYGGSTSFNASTSSAVSQVVNTGVTTTALAASPNPSVVGQSVTFTATVSPVTPSTATPTGTVSFRDNGTEIGQGTLASGVATFTTTALALGTHPITAVYLGNVSFAGYGSSTSPAVSQLVNAGAQTLQLSNATYTTSEGVGTFSATVTRTGGSTGTVGVSFTATPGSATTPGDYTAVTAGPLSFAPGVTSLPISFTIVDDGTGEANETFAVALSSATGGATLGAVTSTTVTITDPVLQVTGTTVTTSGVVVAFNRGFDPATLNLYDSAAGALGAADLTLTGNTTGAVRGSLVVGPGNQVTFLKSGTPLAADTYTLTLRSDATNGFRDLGGAALDGDANGTAGGNYTATPTVAGTGSARVVSIPDFARGAGQAVAVPATAAGLPVVLSDSTGVTTLQADVLFDPTLLAVTGGSVAVAGSSVTVTAITGGVRVTVTGLSGAAATNLTVAYLTASVPAAAPYANKEVVAVRNVTANSGGVSAVGDDALHLAAYLGDTNASRTYSGGDAALASQLSVGSGTGLVAYQNADPLLIADINGNGTLTGGDAALIAQKGVGLTVPSIPDLPGGAAPPAGGPDPRLYLVGGAALPGETTTVQLRMQVTERAGITLGSGDYAIRFDPTRFRVSNVRVGSLLAGFAALANVDNAAGTIRVTEWAAADRPFAFGADGDVLLFDLTVLAAARPGAARLNLLEKLAGNGSTTWTGLANAAGPLTLAPAPTDGAFDPADATFTVLGRRAVLDTGRAEVKVPAVVAVTTAVARPPLDVSRAGAADAVTGFARPDDTAADPLAVGRLRRGRVAAPAG